MAICNTDQALIHANAFVVDSVKYRKVELLGIELTVGRLEQAGWEIYTDVSYVPTLMSNEVHLFLTYNNSQVYFTTRLRDDDYSALGDVCKLEPLEEHAVLEQMYKVRFVPKHEIQHHIEMHEKNLQALFDARVDSKVREELDTVNNLSVGGHLDNILTKQLKTKRKRKKSDAKQESSEDSCTIGIPTRAVA